MQVHPSYSRVLQDKKNRTVLSKNATKKRRRCRGVSKTVHFVCDPNRDSYAGRWGKSRCGNVFGAGGASEDHGEPPVNFQCTRRSVTCGFSSTRSWPVRWQNRRGGGSARKDVRARPRPWSAAWGHSGGVEAVAFAVFLPSVTAHVHDPISPYSIGSSMGEVCTTAGWSL